MRKKKIIKVSRLRLLAAQAQGSRKKIIYLTYNPEYPI